MSRKPIETRAKSSPNLGNKIKKNETSGNTLKHAQSCNIDVQRACSKSVNDKLSSASINFLNFGGAINSKNLNWKECEKASIQSIDRSNSFVVFVSQNVLKESDVSELDTVSPISGPRTILMSIREGIMKLKKNLAPCMKNCYVWIDVLCPLGDKFSEHNYYDIVNFCDCVFTPISAKETVQVHLTANFKQPVVMDWKHVPRSYVNDGRCRMDMLFSSAVPIVGSSGAKNSKFEYDLAEQVIQGRPHFLYWDNKIAQLSSFEFDRWNPLKGVCVYRDNAHLTVSLLQHYRRKIIGNSPTGCCPIDGLSREKMTVFDDDGSIFDGELLCGKRHGQGTCYYVNGSVYCGQWANGKKNGAGTMLYAKGSVYEGQFKNDLRHHFGTHTYSRGGCYEGRWKRGQKCGSGKITSSAGVYEGKFKRGKYHGEGVFRDVDGSEYSGMWCGGVKHGIGIRKSASGDSFEEEWDNGKCIQSEKIRKVHSSPLPRRIKIMDVAISSIDTSKTLSEPMYPIVAQKESINVNHTASTFADFDFQCSPLDYLVKKIEASDPIMYALELHKCCSTLATVVRLHSEVMGYCDCLVFSKSSVVPSSILLAIKAIAEYPDPAVVNRRDPDTLDCLLHSVARIPCLEAVRLLLEYPHVEVDIIDDCLMTPEEIAMEVCEEKDAIKALFKKRGNLLC